MSEINQMIARGVDPIQVQSPVNQLAQIEQIRSAQQTNMLRQEQMAALQREREQLQTLNRLYGEAYSPTTGRVDETKLYSGLAQGGLGSQIPGLQKAELERRKTEFATSKEQSDAALKRIELKRTQLKNVSTPDAYVQWSLSSFDDPVLAPILKEIGSTPEKVIQHIQEVGAQPGGLQRLIEESKLGSDKFAQLVKDRAGTRSPLGKLQAERQELIDAGVGPTDQRVSELNQRILKETTPAGPSTVVLTGTQEKQFEGELGKLQAKELIDSRKEAEDARAIIDTVNTGRELLNEGTLVGAGADFLVGFNNALSRAGLDFGYNDAAKNTQAYAAAIGNNVGRIISLFGAGTGLSDADREFAKLIAGGNTQVTEAALRRILDINERAARGVIALHNERAKGVKTNIPLVVDMPQFNIPDQAVNFLRQNNTPANRRFFDLKYGKSAAKSILGE
jgi:hypothetical protein